MPKRSPQAKPKGKKGSERRLNKSVAKPSKTQTPTLVKVLNWAHAERFLAKRGCAPEQIREKITSGPFWDYHDKAPRELITVLSGDWAMGGRMNGAKVQAKLASSKVKSARISFPDKIDKNLKNAFATSLVLSNYETNLKTDGSTSVVRELDFEAVGTVDKSFNEAVEMAKATNAARALINTRGTVADPAYVEKQILKVFNKYKGSLKLKYESIVGKDLQKKGLNMIYNVGKGATCPPRLVIIQYTGNPKSKQNIALVGKGITYDTGGLHLKGGHGMDTMYYDKGGTGAVFGVLNGTLALKLKVNVCFVFAIAENAIGAESYKPSDIIKSYNGKTVEITNTDAEGRNVMCDGMSYVQRNYKVNELIDIATLTGAVKVALGTETAGLFSNSSRFAAEVSSSGHAVFEEFWQLPIKEEHKRAMKGSMSDLRNADIDSSFGGASKAAAFLLEFVEEGVDWVHLDIAGTGFRKVAKAPLCQGANGFGAQTMLKMLIDRSK